MLFYFVVNLCVVVWSVQKIDYLTEPQCQDNDTELQQANPLIFAKKVNKK